MFCRNFEKETLTYSNALSSRHFEVQLKPLDTITAVFKTNSLSQSFSKGETQTKKSFPWLVVSSDMARGEFVFSVFRRTPSSTPSNITEIGFPRLRFLFHRLTHLISAGGKVSVRPWSWEERPCLWKFWLKYTLSFRTVASALLYIFYRIWFFIFCWIDPFLQDPVLENSSF